MKRIILSVAIGAVLVVSGCIPTSFNPLSFMKVLRIEPTLQMAPLDLKWLRELLAKRPKAIRHEKTDGNGDEAQIVLTASTPDLQRFILKHLSTAGAFGDPSNFIRRSPDPKS